MDAFRSTTQWLPNNHPRRLLILACSKSKRPDARDLPALERYDGPSFRLVRRGFRNQAVKHPEIYILSAEFGLINGTRAIPNYDRFMTPERACELRPRVLARFEHILSSGRYSEIFLCLGKSYLAALDGYRAVVPPISKVVIAQGGHGQKLAALFDWLYQGSCIVGERPLTARRASRATIRGVTVNLSAGQILDHARHFVAAESAAAARYQAWYVVLDGDRVAPKWLVTKLTGLAPGSFGTGEARRFLSQLGVETRRR